MWRISVLLGEWLAMFRSVMVSSSFTPRWRRPYLPKRRESSRNKASHSRILWVLSSAAVRTIECRKYKIHRRELGWQREDGRVSWRCDVFCSLLLVLVVQSGLSAVSCSEWTERSWLFRVDWAQLVVQSGLSAVGCSEWTERSRLFRVDWAQSVVQSGLSARPNGGV